MPTETFVLYTFYMIIYVDMIVSFLSYTSSWPSICKKDRCRSPHVFEKILGNIPPIKTRANFDSKPRYSSPFLLLHSQFISYIKPLVIWRQTQWKIELACSRAIRQPKLQKILGVLLLSKAFLGRDWTGLRMITKIMTGLIHPISTDFLWMEVVKSPRNLSNFQRHPLSNAFKISSKAKHLQTRMKRSKSGNEQPTKEKKSGDQ